MYASEIGHLNPENLQGVHDTALPPLRAALIRQARLLLRDRAAAEDLVQDTLLAVLRSGASMRGEASLTTWAVAILKHKVVDWHRSSSRNEVFQFVGDAEEGNESDFADGAARAFGAAPEAFLQPDRVLEERQLRWAVERCLSRLSAQARQVFAMREQLGFETEEVCQRLDISQDHCRMLLHRARVALRAFLHDRFLGAYGDHPTRVPAGAPGDDKNSRHAKRLANDRLSDCTT